MKNHRVFSITAKFAAFFAKRALFAQLLKGQERSFFRAKRGNERFCIFLSPTGDKSSPTYPTKVEEHMGSIWQRSESKMKDRKEDEL